MSERKGGRILIVDDDRSNIDVLNHILKPVYTIYVAINGLSAIKIAVKNIPDLILLDIVMPDMTGFDVFKELKKYGELRSIPVIFITGMTKSEEAEKGLLMGAADYIVKPFSQIIIKSKVRQHMQRARNYKLLETRAHIDTATGSNNKLGFDEALTRQLNFGKEKNTPLGIIILTIVNFEKYNEIHGCLNGGFLLQAVANDINQLACQNNYYSALTGFGEFCVILPDKELAEVKTIAAALKNSVESAVVFCAWVENKKADFNIRCYSEIPSTNTTASDFFEHIASSNAVDTI